MSRSKRRSRFSSALIPRVTADHDPDLVPPTLRDPMVLIRASLMMGDQGYAGHYLDLDPVILSEGEE